MSHSTDSQLIIFIIGAPGSGKGTLGKRLADEHGFFHLSIGDTMRSVSKDKQAPHHDLVLEHVQQGTLLPTDCLYSILKAFIDDKKQKGQERFLIDGFPRRLDQGKQIEKELGEAELVLFFNCPKTIAEHRYLTRGLADRCDDSREIFEKRYLEFAEQNPAVVEYYKASGKLVEIDSSGETDQSYHSLHIELKHKDTRHNVFIGDVDT